MVLEFIWGTLQKLMHSFLASNYGEMKEILTGPCVTSYYMGNVLRGDWKTLSSSLLAYLQTKSWDDLLYHILLTVVSCHGSRMAGRHDHRWKRLSSKLFSFISQSSEVFVTVAWNWPPSWGSRKRTLMFFSPINNLT